MKEEREDHHGREVERDPQAHGDARAHALLEANIARLLKYAYVPALPSPEFRTRLIALARTEAVRQHRMRGRETRRVPARAWGAALALAATLLVCLWALRWSSGHNGTDLVLTALDPSELPQGAPLTRAAEEAARSEGGHLEGPQGLASTSAGEGQRTPQDTPEAALSNADTGGAAAAPQLLMQVTTATGEPVPEVTLALVPPALQNRIPDPIVHASVAADGRHHFAEPPLGTYRPVVYAPGFSLWSGESVTIERDRERHLDVTLTAGGVLRGFIVDQASGNPIAGARIVPRADAPAAALPFDLTQSDPWLPILAVSATDGSFELPHVSPGMHELHIAADGKATHFEENVQVQSGAVSEVPPIALAPEAVLVGRVWDADGSPSVGTQVVVSPFQMGPEGLSLFALGTTDAEGKYSVGGLPAGRHFAISIPAQPDRAPDVRPFLATPGKTARIEFGRSATDLFGAGSTGPQGTLVTGVLRDATGKGLAVANIALVEHGDQGDSGSSGSFRASSTSADGSFRFEDVAAGDFDLMVVGANNSVSTAGQVHVEAGLAELRVDYQLGAATVSGQVLRATDLAPVQGATVVLLGFAPDTNQVRFLAESTTGADGTWRVHGLSSGSLFAVVYPQKEGATEAGPLGYARTPRVEIPSGQAEIDLGTTALFLGGNVRVLVTDREGRPIEGLHLVITASNGAWAQPNPYLSTFSDGSLNLWGLAPGTYTVRAFPAQGAPQTSHFSVSAGEETSHQVVLD